MACVHQTARVVDGIWPISPGPSSSSKPPVLRVAKLPYFQAVPHQRPDQVCALHKSPNSPTSYDLIATRRQGCRRWENFAYAAVCVSNGRILATVSPGSKQLPGQTSGAKRSKKGGPGRVRTYLVGFVKEQKKLESIVLVARALADSSLDLLVCFGCPWLWCFHGQCNVRESSQGRRMFAFSILVFERSLAQNASLHISEIYL